MIRKTYSFILFLFCNLTTWAQQTYDLPLAKPVTTITTTEFDIIDRGVTAIVLLRL